MLRSLEPYFASSSVLQKSDLWPSWLADSLYKGENYALNFAGDTRVMYLSKALWARAGLDSKRPPRTWNELEETVRRLTRRDSSNDLEVVGYNPNTANWLWYFYQLGGEVADPSGERIVLDRGDAAVRALEFEMRLYNGQGGRDAFTKYHLANGATEQTAGQPSGANYNTMFQQGKVGIYVNTYSHRSEQFRPQGFADESWDYAALPLPPGGRLVNWGGSHAFGIPALAKHPEAAWAWLEHFSLPQNDIEFATRFDRVPVRRESSTAAEYLKGDPFLEHQIEQAWGRRFFPALPGILDLLGPLGRPLTEVYTGQKSPRDAVGQVARDMQVALDRALGKAV
jgi:ABC-type glycerol-3-phosphate transport system substrate-binding protein